MGIRHGHHGNLVTDGVAADMVRVSFWDIGDECQFADVPVADGVIWFAGTRDARHRAAFGGLGTRGIYRGNRGVFVSRVELVYRISTTSL